MMLRSLTLLMALTATPVLAEALNFDLTNGSAVDVTELYASPVGVDSWQENILGGATLAAGTVATVTITESQGCAYDLRVVFADGDVLEQAGNDLCALAAITLQ